MSDYLSHIAERAGSAPAAVRPALPSHFEPVKAGGIFAALSTARGTEPIFEIEHGLQPAGEASDQSRSIHDRVASIQTILNTAVTPATPQPGEPATKRAATELVRSRTTESAMRVFLGESHAVVEPTDESPLKEEVDLPRTALSADLAQRQPIVADVKPASHPLVSSEPTSVRQRAAQSPAAAAAAAPLLTPAIAPVPRAPFASRERASAKTRFASEAESFPAPVIHVTIGRVEVRAILPAVQAPQPPARPSPKLSLDDYLRSRNGGAA